MAAQGSTCMSDWELLDDSHARIISDPSVKSMVRMKEEDVSVVWTKRRYVEPITT